MSREQRTRLNIMISEQTGAQVATRTPGRTTRTEEETKEEDEQAAEAEAAQDAAQAPPERTRSVFDAPYAQELAPVPADAETVDDD